MLVDGKSSFRMCCGYNMQSVKWKGGSCMQKIGSGGKRLKKGKSMIHSVRGRVSQTPQSRPQSFLWRQCRTPFVEFRVICDRIAGAWCHPPYDHFYMQGWSMLQEPSLFLRKMQPGNSSTSTLHTGMSDQGQFLSPYNTWLGFPLWILRNRDVKTI